MAQYQIQSGDTLSQIAGKNKRTIDELMAVNPQITDPNRIYAGQTLNVPSTETPITPTGAGVGTGVGVGVGVGTTQGIDMNQFQNEDPVRKFNLAIWDMLQKAQGGAGSESLYAQRTALQRAAIGRQAEITPEALRGLSPQQQQAIRSGKMGALEPEIDAISAKIKSQNDKLLNFENILGTVREIGLDLAKITPSPEVLEGYKNMLEAGGQPSSVPEEIRDKVLPLVDWNKWQTATNKNAKDQLTLYQQTMLDERNQAQANQIASEFRQEQIVKDYNVISGKYQSVKQILDMGVGGPGDLAIVYEFMKGLDPTSVVRESEYASAAKSGNIFMGTMARFNGYLKEEGGFLPENVKQSFLSIMGAKLNVSSQQYQNLYNSYIKRIDNITGVPGLGQNYMTDYSQAFGGQALTSAIPPEVSTLIEQGLSENKSLEDIRRTLAGIYGQDIGYQYLDKYMQSK